MAVKTEVFAAILFYGYILQNLSHSVNSASDGIRKSPRGERLTEPTLGPSGKHERLNWLMKNLLIKSLSHSLSCSSEYLPEKARDAINSSFCGLVPKRRK